MRGVGAELRRVVIDALDTESLLARFVDVVAMTSHADLVAVLELRGERQTVLASSARGRYGSQLIQQIVDPDPFSRLAVRTGRTVVVRNLRHDHRFPSVSQPGTAALLGGITAVIEGPRQPFGVLTGRWRKANQFEPSIVGLLSDAAGLLAIALLDRSLERRRGDVEGQFQLLADRSPDILFRTRLVPGVQVEYVSPSVEQVTGYSTAEILEREGRSRLLDMIHPEDRPEVDAFLADPRAATYPLIVRHFHKDGSILWLEQRLTPVTDTDGHVVLIEGVLRNVTTRMNGEELRQAREDVTEAILAGQSADEVLRLIGHHARRLANADLALVVQEMGGPEAWRVSVVDGDPAGELEGTMLSGTGPLLARAKASETAISMADLSAELPKEHALLRLGFSGGAVFVPVRISGRLLGILAIVNRDPKRPFNQPGVAALDHFARQSALAIQQGQALRDGERLAVLEDRARIARELHDGVIQSLFGAGMLLEATKEMERLPASATASLTRIADMVDRTILDLRGYIFDLEPGALAGGNLSQALRQLAEDVEATTSLQCAVSIEAEAVRSIQASGPQIVQIVREALSNIVRHATSPTVRIDLRRRGADTVLEISDQGKGFNPARVRWGSGLSNIARRATEIGGRAEFISEPGAGSAVQLVIPVSAGTTPP